MSDKKALKILFNTYWSSAGWKEFGTQTTTHEDFIYAKNAGVMFDPVVLTHDEIVARAMKARQGIEPHQVANAFTASLTSRRLDQRSALGSFALLYRFPDHQEELQDRWCRVCGEYVVDEEPHDLNVMNFERFKWGGVRHDQPLYAALDLELFPSSESVSPTEDDIVALRQLLNVIREVADSSTSSQLQKILSPVLRSNKAERNVLIGILGLCGIMATDAHPGHFPVFVPFSERELPSRRFVDMAYPSCWWRGSDGLNEEAVEFWFGHLLQGNNA